MKKRWLVRIGIVGMLAVAALLIIPKTRYIISGCIRGEPFFEGMPASYWKDEVQDWVTPRSFNPQALDQARVGVRLAMWFGFGRVHDESWPKVLDGDKTAVPVLIELVKEEELWMRVYAMRSLGRIGPDAREAVPTLIAVLNDTRDVPGWEPNSPIPSDGWGDFGPMYREAVRALGLIGPDAKIAVPPIMELRRPLVERNPDNWWNDYFDYALKRIDPVAAAAAGIK